LERLEEAELDALKANVDSWVSGFEPMSNAFELTEYKPSDVAGIFARAAAALNTH